MPSISGVFGGSRSSTSSDSPKNPKSSVTRTQSLTDVEEHQQLEDAMRGVALMLDDDQAAAEKALEADNSVYHKLGLGVVWFMRATMGYEPEIMRGANERLGIAESAATEQKKRAQRDSRAFRSDIYPPGTEYAMCNAQAQILSAVIGLTTESLSDALKGFYKVKKALATLESVAEAERQYLKRRSDSSVDSPQPNDQPNGKPNGQPNGAHATSPDEKDQPDGINGVQSHSIDGDDEELFADAPDSPTEPDSTTQQYLGHMESSGILHDMSDLSHAPTKSSSAGPPTLSDPFIPVSDFKNSVDIFVHSGWCLFQGMLLLMLSFVPPTFNKILSLIGFRGDRNRGLALLWRASGFPGLNGSLAGLTVIGFYSGTISSLEIVPSDTIPREAWDELTAKLRHKYPKSGLILVEDARSKITARRLDEAQKLLTEAPKNPIKQIESIRCFELALTSMYLHRYEQCADAFLKYIELNTWSHATCYYIAAACHIELYRTHKYGSIAAPHTNGTTNGDTTNHSPCTVAPDSNKAKEHAARAEELLAKVPQHIGKKRMFSGRPPFDTFVARKHAKWTARAQARGVPLVDAVGVSPMEEMVYFWAGYKRMPGPALRESLVRLRFTDAAAADPGFAPDGFEWSGQASAGFDAEADDEKASLALLRATVYRHLADTKTARGVLGDEIINRHSWSTFKGSGGGSGGNGDLWALPCARYELAACAWDEREAIRAQGGDRAAEAKLLNECGAALEAVANWDNFDLDTRIGMKIAAGRESVKKAKEAS